MLPEHPSNFTQTSSEVRDIYECCINPPMSVPLFENRRHGDHSASGALFTLLVVSPVAAIYIVGGAEGIGVWRRRILDTCLVG